MKLTLGTALSAIIILSGCAGTPRERTEEDPPPPPSLRWDDEEGDDDATPTEPTGPRRSRWEGPRMRTSWHLSAYSGVQHLLGGEFDGVITPVGFPGGSSIGVNLPVGETMAIGPYVYHEVFGADVRHTDMWWLVSTVGGGLRYFFHYVKEFDVYVKADGAYVHWDGMDDDRVSHPDFDFTLFKPEGPARFEPRDLDGYSISLGVGVHGYAGDWFGLGFEIAWRYHNGTEGYDAHWFEWGSTLLFRF